MGSTERVDQLAVSMYLVERYWPGVTPGALGDAIVRLDEAVDGVDDAGGRVRHVESTIIPADDTVFSLFEATSAESVLEVNRRAHVAADRISSCLWFPVAPRAVKTSMDVLRASGHECGLTR